MASIGHLSAFPVGHNINCPPFFNGSNYTAWKAHMRVFLLSVDYEVWQIVESGYPKDTSIGKLHSLNAKAMYALYCALNDEEFNCVSSCSTAQEIWLTLQNRHEDHLQVSKESITTEDLSASTKPLKRTDGTSSLQQQQRNQNTKVRKDKIDDSVAEPLCHKCRKPGHIRKNCPYKKTSPNEENSEDLEEENKVESDSDGESDSELSSIVKGFKEFLKPKRDQLILQRKGSDRSKSFRKNKHDDNSNTEQLCHYCRKSGHFYKKCPRRDKDLRSKGESSNAAMEEHKGKNQLSTDSMHNNEVNSFCCLMAREESCDESSSEDEVCTSCHKWISMCEEMAEDHQELEEKYKSLKKKYSKLKEENHELNEKLNATSSSNTSNDNCLICSKYRELSEELTEELYDEKEKLNSQLTQLSTQLANEQQKFETRCLTIVTENEALKSKLYDLEKLVQNFTHSSKGLNMLLSNQRFAKPKIGLGYSYSVNSKKFQKSVVRGNNLNMCMRISNASSSICFLCGRMGHISNACRLQYRIKIVKQIWVPKGTIPDQGGPFWIPKPKLNSFL